MTEHGSVLLACPDPHAVGANTSASPVVVVLHGGPCPDTAAHSLRCARTVANSVSSYGGEAHLVEAAGFALPSLVDKLDGEVRALVTTMEVPRDAGSLQGLLNYLEIPYAGSGVAGCAIAAHQVTARRLLQAAHVPVPAYGLVRPRSSPYSEAQRIMRQASAGVVRIQPQAPARGPAGPGDSVWRGPSTAAGAEALSDLLTVAGPFGPLMYESDEPGQTLWVGVIDDAEGQPHTLPGLEAEPRAAADKETLGRARRLALRAQRALHLRGYALHRFTRSQDTGLFWREVQTHPDLSPTGRLFQITSAHHGWTHLEFIEALLNTCDTDLTEGGR